tara:strand:+ start:131 stop:505 length:375 start_codon:yes stop_codon:yes gene_type:complete
MAIRSKENYWGAWGFLVGIILALAVGILSASLGELSGYILGILVILGLMVGFINVSPKDQNAFLMTAVSLVIVSFAGAEGISGIEFLNIGIGNMVSSTLGALLVMLVPATIVVAIKSLFSISQK